MKNQRKEVGGASFHVFVVRDASDAERVRSLIEQNDYNVSIVASGTENSPTPQGCDAFHCIAAAAPGATVVEVQRSGRQQNRTSTVSRAKFAGARDALNGDYRDIIGESPQVFEMLKAVEAFAPSPSSVLILGETGTGKELIARALHRNGRAPQKEMVVVDCGAITESLAENELFGHEKGAFTDAHQAQIGLFEKAQGSTLFFDEIGELPMSLQSTLLRTLQEREIRTLGGTKQIHVDVRIVAATNRELLQEVEAGTFRRDLYERLHVFSIRVPPLRERPEDIRMLVEHFLETESPIQGYPVSTLSPEVFALFRDYAWPGNIRELQNAISHAIVFAKGRTILREHLPEHFQESQAQQLELPEEAVELHEAYIVNLPLRTTVEETLKAVEKACIESALVQTGDNRIHAAKVLGMSQRTFNRRLKSHQIPGRQYP